MCRISFKIATPTLRNEYIVSLVQTFYYYFLQHQIDLHVYGVQCCLDQIWTKMQCMLAVLSQWQPNFAQASQDIGLVVDANGISSGCSPHDASIHAQRIFMYLQNAPSGKLNIEKIIKFVHLLQLPRQ